MREAHELSVSLRRRLSVARAVFRGATYQEVARKLGVSNTKCRELVKRVMRDSSSLRGDKHWSDPEFYNIRLARANAAYWLEGADMLARCRTSNLWSFENYTATTREKLFAACEYIQPTEKTA